MNKLTDGSKPSLLEQTVDQWPVAIAAIDEHGCVKFANSIARKLLRKLKLSEVNIAGQLAVVGNSVLSIAMKNRAPCVSVSRGKVHDYALLKLFYSEQHEILDVLMVADNQRLLAATPKEKFGLSTAEAAVANDLLNGYTLAQIATRRDTTKNTVRTQLRAIFKKTGTHRQVELISLFLSDDYGLS